MYRMDANICFYRLFRRTLRKMRRLPVLLLVALHHPRRLWKKSRYPIHHLKHHPTLKLKVKATWSSYLIHFHPGCHLHPSHRPRWSSPPTRCTLALYVMRTSRRRKNSPLTFAVITRSSRITIPTIRRVKAKFIFAVCAARC